MARNGTTFGPQSRNVPGTRPRTVRCHDRVPRPARPRRLAPRAARHRGQWLGPAAVPPSADRVGADRLDVGFGVGFTSVGAMLVDRRPHEPVSRITLVIGLLVVAAVGLRALAVALDARPGDLPPVGALAAILASALLFLAIVAAGGFLLVRFPNGAQGDRLTGVVNLLFALMVGGVVVVTLKPGPIDIGGVAGAENPIGVGFVDEVASRPSRSSRASPTR